MKIVADKDIPFVEHYFASAGDLILVPGRALSRADVMDADVLLVRSITNVNQALLENTSVKYVASPTTGMDHFDTEWLDAAKIRWAHAQGCNAVAVKEYVICALASLMKRGYFTETKKRAAVIGVGTIGRLVVEALLILGFEVLQCDPLRAAKEKDFQHTPLEEIEDIDLVTLHTPLTRDGAFPTYHMIDKHFLQRQKENAILLNTGRGAVIDFNDLKTIGGKLVWCLDVWEHEPFIDFDILDLAEIATPHIAGYTVQSKYRAVHMIYHQAIKDNIIQDVGIQPLVFPSITMDALGNTTHWQDVVLSVYDPFDTTAFMKQKMIEDPRGGFDTLRKNFVERHEFAYVSLDNVKVSATDSVILERLFAN